MSANSTRTELTLNERSNLERLEHHAAEGGALLPLSEYVSHETLLVLLRQLRDEAA